MGHKYVKLFVSKLLTGHLGKCEPCENKPGNNLPMGTHKRLVINVCLIGDKVVNNCMFTIQSLQVLMILSVIIGKTILTMICILFWNFTPKRI